MDKRIKDLTGSRYGKLVVISLSQKRSKWGETIWNCLCDCGNLKEIVGRSLTRGKTKSCGCLCVEKAKQTHTKHAKSASGSYATWEAMIQRCKNPNSSNYKNYGGRGIDVCEDWLQFEKFYEDMGDRPEGYSIDRIDNTKSYSKNNCRWATKQQQSFNTFLNINNTSGTRGVHYCKERGKWVGKLKFGETIFSRRFENKEDAIKYRKLLEEMFDIEDNDYGKRN